MYKEKPTSLLKTKISSSLKKKRKRIRRIEQKIQNRKIKEYKYHFDVFHGLRAPPGTYAMPIGDINYLIYAFERIKKKGEASECYECYAMPKSWRKLIAREFVYGGRNHGYKIIKGPLKGWYAVFAFGNKSAEVSAWVYPTKREFKKAMKEE